MYITKLILEFALWSKFYGYDNKVYQFEIKSAVDFEL